PAGLGKWALARVLAASLVCEQSAGRGCGACDPCRQVSMGTHVDVWEEAPQGSSHKIGVDQVHELQRRLGFRRAGERFRVVLIDEAGSMNVHAQNKLLKTLEEPPEGTVLVLCAVHPGQLLQTVRSRCQKINLGSVEPPELATWLVERHQADPEHARRAAVASRGVPGRALDLLADETVAQRQQRMEGLWAALDGDAEALGSLVSAVDRDRRGCAEVLTTLQELLRDAMVRRTGAAVAGIHAADGSEVLQRLDARQLAGWIERVEDVRERLHRNVHPGALMDDLLFRMHQELR
ncbi:MAG TPA: hypothetical protein DIU15_07225, partial [Deltaproteobacteria bacterium]|nr:hypothetical protein [Deltaproteobacteria bacterium]